MNSTIGPGGYKFLHTDILNKQQSVIIWYLLFHHNITDFNILSSLTTTKCVV